MAEPSPSILRCAIDPQLLRNLIRRNIHIRILIRNRRKSRAIIGQCQSGAMPAAQPNRALRIGLNAARQNDLSLPRYNHRAGQRQRIQPTTTLTIDAIAANALWQISRQRHHSGRIAASAQRI